MKTQDVRLTERQEQAARISNYATHANLIHMALKVAARKLPNDEQLKNCIERISWLENMLNDEFVWVEHNRRTGSLAIIENLNN